MRKSISSQRRTFITQDLQNLYPLESRAREFKYSVVAQAFNPIAIETLYQQLEVERVLNNYVPALFDTEEVDVVYRVPNIFGTATSTPKFYIGTSTTFTDVIKSDPDLDSFWYSKLPTRIEVLSTSQRTLYTEKLSSIYQNSTNTAYSLQANYLGTGTDEFAGSDVAESFDGYTYNIYCTSGTQASVRITSTQTATDPALLFDWFDNVENTAILRKEIRYGIDGIGTATSTDTSINYLINKRNHYFYEGIGQTGVPFLQIDYFMTSTSTSDVDIKNWYIKDFAQIQNQSSNVWMNQTFSQENPNYAFVYVRNGSSLSAQNIARPSDVGGVIIKGINNHGVLDSELVNTPFNGVHQSIKTWVGLTEVLPYELPAGCYFDVELQNYQKRVPLLDSVQYYSNSMHKGLLFRSISTDAGTAFLNFHTIYAPDLSLSSTEGLLLAKKIELRDSSDSAFQAIDAAYDFSNQLVYVLGTDSRVHLFDLFDHWPSQSAIETLRLRSFDPKHSIEFENAEDDSPSFGETKTITHYWKDRSVPLNRHRWILKKPDGSMVGIKDDFTEATITSDFWIKNTELKDMQRDEYRFNHQRVPITFNQYGDYSLFLETEYMDEETFELFRERDVAIFSVFKKTALKTFQLNSDFGVPIGIDFLPNKDLVFAFSNPDNPYNLFEETYRLRYDYYYVSANLKELVFRENYGHVYLILESSGDEEVCQKTVLVKTNNDALTAGQVNCYLVVANSSGGALSFSLPAITNDINGMALCVKRYGANGVTVSPNAGDTIDGAASLSLVSDLDSYTLVAVFSLNMWMIV